MNSPDFAISFSSFVLGLIVILDGYYKWHSLDFAWKKPSLQWIRKKYGPEGEKKVKIGIGFMVILGATLYLIKLILS